MFGKKKAKIDTLEIRVNLLQSELTNQINKSFEAIKQQDVKIHDLTKNIDELQRFCAILGVKAIKDLECDAKSPKSSPKSSVSDTKTKVATKKSSETKTKQGDNKAKVKEEK